MLKIKEIKKWSKFVKQCITCGALYVCNECIYLSIYTSYLLRCLLNVANITSLLIANLCTLLVCSMVSNCYTMKIKFLFV